MATNVSRWLDIPNKDLQKYVGTERERFILEKLKAAGFDLNKHVGTKKKPGFCRFIQNYIKDDGK